MIGLGDNGLVGAFPSFFFNLSMLEIISFPENQLQGSLPSNLCLSQPHLTRIEFAINHFNGFLPPSISSCSELEILDVYQNDLKGGITIDFGRLQHLSFLSLGFNSFGSNDLDDMNFFHSLSNCSNLETIELLSNQLGGVLPNSIGNFSSKLSYLKMQSNYISGIIPSSIGNLLGLTTVSLSVNSFTGMIPESIGELQNLQILYLYDNHFSGVIPRSIGNLSLLTKVVLGGNKLEGTIPSTIGSWKKVIALDLHGNKLSGSVPKELFQLSQLSIGLDLSQNNLSGVLPQEIGDLKFSGILDFSVNRFTGELPSSLSRCTSLEALDLSSNLFYGSLPESFGSLKGLEYVDLSNNNFSGHILTYLQQIPLKHLNLSYNNFDGEVPIKGVFANASAISVTGNIGLCGGIANLHLPKCTSTARTPKDELESFLYVLL
uniref:non-specific serine/threonine protein kinase n=1 Tax=Helianthus annuus TaxID=4232 RepID=A0A251UFP7_HELAN